VFQADALENTYEFAGPEDIMFATLIDRLSAYFGVHVMKFFIPVFFVQAVTSLLNVANINTLVPDQIPRLLCDKQPSIHSEIPLLNYKPRKLEEGLRLYFSCKD